MYRGRPWTIRQYSGFGTAEATNERWRLLLAGGGTGLSCAFDLPTQMGFDSDHPRAEGEVGKVGVAIDSIDDMRVLLSGLPLDQVTTSMTINATAAILLLLYQLVAEEQGVPGAKLGGTIQNDILKEYVARGTYIYPPRQSMRLITDIFAYCREHLPNWNTISISGYHIREAGSTAVQEIAFTLANGIAYVQAAVDAGLPVDEFAPRLSFFWNAHNNFFEEVAKFRAARRMWAPHHDRAVRGGGREEQAAAVPHPDRGLHPDGAAAGEQHRPGHASEPGRGARRDPEPARQRVRRGARACRPRRRRASRCGPSRSIANESGVVDTVDPLGGSYFVESLTDAVEADAWAYIEKIDGMGGAVAAIEAGYMQDEIEQAAYAYAKAVDSGEKVIVGVNRYVDDDPSRPRCSPSIRPCSSTRSTGSGAPGPSGTRRAVDAALADVAAAARGSDNLLPPMKEALRRRATLGEVSDVLRAEFGVYQPSR